MKINMKLLIVTKSRKLMNKQGEKANARLQIINLGT